MNKRHRLVIGEQVMRHSIVVRRSHVLSTYIQVGPSIMKNWEGDECTGPGFYRLQGKAASAIHFGYCEGTRRKGELTNQLKRDR